MTQKPKTRVHILGGASRSGSTAQAMAADG